LILQVGGSAWKQLHSRYSGIDCCNTPGSKRHRAIVIDHEIQIGGSDTNYSIVGSEISNQ
jgi:hypothetical protein